MLYELPKAYTLTPSSMRQHLKKQKAIDELVKKYIQPNRERGIVTFSWATSEFRDVFTAHELIQILTNAGYEVEYGDAGRMLGRFVKTGNTDDISTDMMDAAMVDNMTIYW